MNPNKKTIATPDSDQTARRDIDERDPTLEDQETDIEGRQVSNKSGKHSSVEKLAASRPEFGASPGANPVPGAHGDAGADEEEAPSGAHRDKALRPKP
jgi:hypothetical protein